MPRPGRFRKDNPRHFRIQFRHRSLGRHANWMHLNLASAWFAGGRRQKYFRKVGHRTLSLNKNEIEQVIHDREEPKKLIFPPSGILRFLESADETHLSIFCWFLY